MTLAWILFVVAAFLANVITYDVKYELYLRSHIFELHIAPAERAKTDAGEGLSILFQILIIIFVTLVAIFKNPWWLPIILYVGAFLLFKIYRGISPYTPRCQRNAFDALVLYFGKFIVPILLLIAFLIIIFD